MIPVKVSELIDKGIFETVNIGSGTDTEITKVYCCDLLSFAMGKAPAGGAWVTVMANMNTLAVASLTETAVVILAENAMLDDNALSKAAEQEITVLKTKKPVFDAALEVYELIK